MCKAEKEEVSVLKNIFKVYGDATGQRINYEKSSITFGALVGSDCKGWIQDELGITNEGGQEPIWDSLSVLAALKYRS